MGQVPPESSPPKVSPVPIQERSRRERTWLELLKEVAPRVTRIGVVRKDIIAGIGQLATIQSIAQSFGVELRPIGVSDAAEIERAITAFASGPNGSSSHLRHGSGCRRSIRTAISWPLAA